MGTHSSPNLDVCHQHGIQTSVSGWNVSLTRANLPSERAQGPAGAGSSWIHCCSRFSLCYLQGQLLFMASDASFPLLIVIQSSCPFRALLHFKKSSFKENNDTNENSDNRAGIAERGRWGWGTRIGVSPTPSTKGPERVGTRPRSYSKIRTAQVTGALAAACPETTHQCHPRWLLKIGPLAP